MRDDDHRAETLWVLASITMISALMLALFWSN